MKKNFFTILAAGCIALVAINGANAQGLENPGISQNGKNSKAESTVTPNAAAYSYDPSSKVLRKLSRMYKNIPLENWTKLKEGYCVDFISKEVKNRDFYDTDGKWSGSVKSYAEDKLPNEIKKAVKRKYRSYTILRVEEVETTASNDVPTYIVHLEDKNIFKLVICYEGQIAIWKEFKKG